MTTLTEILNNPEEHYPGNFDTPERAVALLTGLCQDAATEIERLKKREWIGLDDTDLAVCDTDGVLVARYWERVLREKNT